MNKMNDISSSVNDALIRERRPLAMYITGGGTEAVPALLKNGGASAYMMETVINYCPESTHQLIGYVPKHYATSEVARALAMKAYERAKELSGKDSSIGLGATAKLYKAGERQGRAHEIHVALQTEHITIVHSAKLSFTNRLMEEHIATDMILKALHALVGYGNKRVDFGIENANVEIVTQQETYPLFNKFGYSIKDFLHGSGMTIGDSYVFPGSFNPVHKQHLAVAETIYRLKNKVPWFEISIKNTDKPMIDAIDLRARMKGIEDNRAYVRGILVTDKSMFVDKVKQYGANTVFVVGTDTINRVFDPKYYSDAAQFLERKNLKFLVFPRKGYQLRPEVLNNPSIEVVLDTEYEDDGTSSTLIRNAK